MKLKKIFITIFSLLAISLLSVACRNNSEEPIPIEKAKTIETVEVPIKEIEEVVVPEKEFLYAEKLKTSVYNLPKSENENPKKVIDTLDKSTRVLVVERKDIEIIKEKKENKPTQNVKKEIQKETKKVEKPLPPKPKKVEKPFVNDDEMVKIITPENANKIDDNIKEPEKTKEIQKEDSEKINNTENATQNTETQIQENEIKEYEHWVFVKYRKNLKEREGWILEKNLTKDPHENLPKSWNGLILNNFPEKVEFEDNPRIDVKGVYLTVYSASLEKKLDSLIELAKETKINAFVIDVKDDGGQLLFKMDDSILKYNPKAFSQVYVKDIDAFMKKLKDNNIYTIARIVSFKDPIYAKQNPDKAIIEKKTGKPFVNKDGIIWVSPHDKNLWEYNIAVAKEAARVGFNEIQFDYVRFPASNGGKLDAFLDYRNPQNDSKPVTIQKYLKYAWEELTPLHVYINADIYGQIGTFKDDMGLGQYWEAISGYVHYISPMMYPSHYINGAYGIPVPDANPYRTIYHSTIDSINRNENIDNPAILRPWIQDFTAKWVKGHIVYDVKEINEQIKALEDLGVKEYLLWSPSNRYHMQKIK